MNIFIPDNSKASVGVNVILNYTLTNFLFFAQEFCKKELKFTEETACFPFTFFHNLPGLLLSRNFEGYVIILRKIIYCCWMEIKQVY